MINRIGLAAAGLLALALSSGAAQAAACANGATNGYNMKDSNGTLQCVAGLVLGDGRILQFTTPVDQTGSAIAPALSSLQTTGNNTLASILSGQATAALQGTANTSLASILSTESTAALQTAGNASLATLATASATQATAAGQTAMTTALGTLNSTINSTAIPTSNAGTSIGNTTGVPGFQGVTGGVPVSTLGQAPVNTYKLASAASGTNATSFATTAKRISSIRVCSAVSTPRFLKVFDKATPPVPGTDPVKFTIPLPSAGCAFTDAYSLSNGLGIAITAGASDTDTTAVSAGDVYGLNIDTN